MGPRGNPFSFIISSPRNSLHENVHVVDRDPTEGEAREILRSTAAAILVACNNIRLEDDMKAELMQRLLP